MGSSLQVIASIVDWAALGRTALASLTAGVGLALAFSLGLHGFVRSNEARAGRRPLAAFGFGLLAALGLLTCLALAAGGIAVMIRG